MPGYETALKQFTLKKFLQLVYFLDQAKSLKLIKHNPCLFCKDSAIKVSGPNHSLHAFLVHSCLRSLSGLPDGIFSNEKS
jgi:hypothetical protein